MKAFKYIGQAGGIIDTASYYSYTSEGIGAVINL
jgi:hypothetical protein